METNPAFYGLSVKHQLSELDNNVIGIYRVLKSRIIQKDAIKIVAIASQIKKINPNLEVTLVCTRNICSKSLALLELEKVSVKFVELKINKQKLLVNGV